MLRAGTVADPTTLAFGEEHMTYTLYSSLGSGGFAVEAALAKASAPYTYIEIDTANQAHKQPKFLKINPMGQVPAMMLPDGTLMTESAAMVIHLAHLFPKASLAPKPGTSAHAKVLRWMLFMACNLYEADLRYYYPARYTTDPAGADAVKAAGAAYMDKSFPIIEAGLDPYLAGKDLGIADVYLAMLTTWAPQPLKSAKFAALRAAVVADNVYGPIWRRHGMVT